MDKRKKYFLVVDVETANDVLQPLVYDVGFLVGDRQGNIYGQYSFAVSEMFDHYKPLLDNAYYAEKLPQYFVEMEKGERIKTSLFSIRKVMIDIMRKYNIMEVYAYNCGFDRKALTLTQRYFTKSKYRWFFPFGTKFHCIWHMACTTLFQQKSFREKAILQNWFSPSGKNFSTTAEIAYRYITGENDFTEQHKGLDDVIIEYQILLKCISQHKKIDKTINGLCWRKVQSAKT